MAHVPRRESSESPRQDTRASPRHMELSASQLKEWYKTQETHEQLAVGEKTSRSFAKTLGFLEEIDKRMHDNHGEAESTRG